MTEQAQEQEGIAVVEEETLPVIEAEISKEATKQKAMIILQYPHKMLLRKCDTIDVENQRVKIDSIAADMRVILDHAAGIAAPQMGYPLRMIGVWYGNEKLILINPEIVKTSKQKGISQEGCLSINKGRTSYTVKRFKLIKVKALDVDGQPVTYKARDVFARSLQHEIDHLDGILINNTAYNRS